MEARNSLIRRAVWLLLTALLWGSSGRAGSEPALPMPALRPLEATSAAAPPPPPLGLDDLVRLGLDHNPALRQAAFDIDAARGRAVQAGLYPNPTVNVIGEEVGRRGGIYTLPLVSQELVTGGKLGLSRAVADRQVDQTHLALLRQRFALLTAVRQGYFETLAAQRRVEVLEELLRLATRAEDNARQLLEAKLIPELDRLQFQVELDRLRADLDAAGRERDAARRRVAATVGLPDLPPSPLAGSLEAPLPEYDFERARAFVLEEHPDVRSARVGVTRAQLALRREEAERVPNVTVSAGYQRNQNDRENEANIQVAVPLRVWNHNQGNVQAARAELGRAAEDVARVQNELVGRLATAFGQYAAARTRADRYRTSIVPAASRAYSLSLDAFKGGQFEYLRVLQAQRAVGEANQEYLRALAEAWRAASEVSGLLLEECWPAPAVVPPTAGPQ